MELTFTNDLEALLATTAEQFAFEGAAREVAVLIDATPYISWWENDCGINYYSLDLLIPSLLYSQISKNVQQCEEQILEKMQKLTKSYSEGLKTVNITPSLNAEEDWRKRLNNWLAGDSANNQGRVRSDNIASKECDGLLFRSENEMLFYKAFKSTGVPFAPLPVFIKGGESYKRIEPDFVIVKNEVIVVVEIDGDTVHRETPAEAHDRTSMLCHEGVQIERIKASDCATQEQAKTQATKILQILEKIKSSR